MIQDTARSRLGSKGTLQKTWGSMALTFNLQPATLNNVQDPAGLWQYEGGILLENGEKIGRYATAKRTVVQGTDAQNTAMLTIQLFFDGATPPQTLVLHGAHSFNTGEQVGSVSAASANLLPTSATRSHDLVTC
jgi:hypothetical protein